jgi:hypothetical protein
MVRYEFGPSSRGRLARWLSEAFAGTIMRWPVGCGNRPGRVVDLSDRLPLLMPRRAFARGGCKPEARNRPAGQRPAAAARIESNRDIGAMRRRLSVMACPAMPCFQVDDVSMANPQLSGRHSGGADVSSRHGRV